ncbi:hypothetical protein KSP40_PGU009256 [Platanthera guangdongensis]|uniref:Uncharacterized protein n=1 Tax=Platanthera guangdongensis TaxID=2320717 RepID=A0ABR2MUH5_9ASPA
MRRTETRRPRREGRPRRTEERSRLGERPQRTGRKWSHGERKCYKSRRGGRGKVDPRRENEGRGRRSERAGREEVRLETKQAARNKPREEDRESVYTVRLDRDKPRDWLQFDPSVYISDRSSSLSFLQKTSCTYSPVLSSSIVRFICSLTRKILIPPVTSPGVLAIPVGRENYLMKAILGGQIRLLEILWTSLLLDESMLLGWSYGYRAEKAVFKEFGKENLINDRLYYQSRVVIPTHPLSYVIWTASKLAPKKWGLSGTSGIMLLAFIGGANVMISQGIDMRPNFVAVLALATMDAVFLGGSCLAQILFFWPPYKRRVLVHEAGHLLTAYLMGCPIRGVILDPIVAMQMGIQGQAGTQFWDERLEKELAEGRLSSTAFDRYCMVLFAGIAAEALIYGEAEGGENDENLFRSICLLLQSPLTLRQMANQARWSVMQSYNLLKWHKHAHRAAVKALEAGHSLSVVIRRIEEAMSSGS